MPGLIEVKDDYEHYFIDASGVKHGEFRIWFRNGQIRRDCFFVDGRQHGEYKVWNEGGVLQQHCFYLYGHKQGEYKVWHNDGLVWRHRFYLDGQDITCEVKSLVRDISNISSEERVLIKLKFGIVCLD